MIDVQMTNSTSLRFWNFSLTYYQHPKIPEILLGLQNLQGVDINLTLLALWVGRVEGTALLKHHFQTLDSSIADWRHNVIQPLRKIRQTVKVQTALSSNFSDNFLGMTADIELESERICQALLCQEYLGLKNLSKGSNKKGLAASNLSNYFSLLALPKSPNNIETRHKLVNFAEEIVSPPP
ncbi:MAG: TIGR02444 family protein [Rhodospirillaceae bacterium]|nr:TIGR02444 family protein [Rhodospirillaceae bacterium]